MQCFSFKCSITPVSTRNIFLDTFDGFLSLLSGALHCIFHAVRRVAARLRSFSRVPADDRLLLQRILEQNSPSLSMLVNSKEKVRLQSEKAIQRSYGKTLFFGSAHSLSCNIPDVCSLTVALSMSIFFTS